MSEDLRIALVGGGRIADMHAPGYLSSPHARLYALCDLDKAVLERRRTEWALERTFTSFTELLADPKVDAVEILTPHHLHREMVLQAAAAGKHVSVQKPMAMTIEECDEMIAACKRAGVTFKVFENFVFHPPYMRARSIIENGDIGEPMTIRTRLGAGYGGWEIPLRAWAWRLNEKESGGGPTVFDDGYHKFSVAMDFFGRVDSVSGWIETSFGLIDTPAALAWKHAGGTLGYMDAALTPNLFIEGAYYPADERVEITGTKGTIHITSCTGRPVEGPPLIVVKDGRIEAHTDLDDDWQASFTGSVHDFIDALRENRAPRLSGEEGRDVTAFALACLRAAAQGKTIVPDAMEANARCEV